MKRVLAILAGAGVLLLMTAFFVYQSRTGEPGNGDQKVDFEVKSGWGPAAVTDSLARKELIKSRTFFRLALRLQGKTGKIKKGVYALNNGMNASEVIAVITSGVTKSIHITIPEGWHNRQIGDLLTEKGFFASRADFLKAASDPELLKKYQVPAKTLEGYLFPETYTIPIGYPGKKVIETMVEMFLSKTKTLDGFPKDPMKRHRLIILASIVEREAQLKEERALIAGVFANRIEKHYPLESCATIQYLYEKPKKRLYFKDLEVDSPYNTYKINGLPPGPIANPGLAAIDASLHPQKTDYMFFVIRGDGSHQFSKSFNEHTKAKNKYLGP